MLDIDEPSDRQGVYKIKCCDHQEFKYTTDDTELTGTLLNA